MNGGPLSTPDGYHKGFYLAVSLQGQREWTADVYICQVDVDDRIVDWDDNDEKIIISKDKSDAGMTKDISLTLPVCIRLKQ